MGQHFITPAAAGKHLRDDYGAAAAVTFTPACFTFPNQNNARIKRSFPVVQPRKVDAMGRLNHVA
ncbi:hypothetical protein J3D56_003903 [Erwinia persicina]|nr:hypothetical protein [Erwinia persicina]